MDSDLDIAIELDETVVPPGDDSDAGIATWMFEAPKWREEISKIIPLELQLEHYAGKKTPIISKGLQESTIVLYEKTI